MKILQLISYFAPAWAYGGSVRAVYEISKGLVHRGHEVTVCTTDVLDANSRVKKKFDRIEGIEVYYFPTISNWFSWHFKGFISPGMYQALDKKIRNFDIVHLHECYTFQAIITHHLCQKYQVPYIFSGHGSVAALPERGRTLLKKLYLKFWGEKILRDATCLTAVTQKEKEQYLTFSGVSQKIQIVPNGINLNDFESLPRKGKFRRRYNFSPQDKIVLYLGRLYKLKGLENLIYAFAALRKNMPTAYLVIIGPSVGGYQKELEKIVQKLALQRVVIFTGFLEGEEKLSPLVEADVLVLPSLNDVFGMVVLEAMACGCPVIVTEGVGLGETIDGIAGLRVRNNIKDLKKGLLRVLQNQRIREKFSQGGKTLVKKFDQKIITTQIEQIYQEAIA